LAYAGAQPIGFALGLWFRVWGLACAGTQHNKKQEEKQQRLKQENKYKKQNKKRKQGNNSTNKRHIHIQQIH